LAPSNDLAGIVNPLGKAAGRARQHG
jgi:hypothetical protein